MLCDWGPRYAQAMATIDLNVDHPTKLVGHLLAWLG
jgi:hypothetical protein